MKISSYKKFFLIVLVLFLSIKSIGQESNLVEEVWFQYYNISNFSNKLSLSSDAGYRLKEGAFMDRSQYFIRSGVAYNFNRHVKVLVGVSYFKTHFQREGLGSEFRPYQQFSTNHKFGNIGFGNRIRIEERFIKIAEYDEDVSTSSFNFRFRYRFMFDVPVVRLSKSNEEARLSLTIGDEILFSADKGSFFDYSAQNRFLLGPVVHFNKNNKLLLLYNFTSVIKDIPDVSDEYGIFWIGFKQVLDYRK